MILFNNKFLLLCHNCHGLVLCPVMLFMRKFSCITGGGGSQIGKLLHSLRFFMSQGCRACNYQHFCTLQIILIKIKGRASQYIASCSLLHSHRSDSIDVNQCISWRYSSDACILNWSTQTSELYLLSIVGHSVCWLILLPE